MGCSLRNISWWSLIFFCLGIWMLRKKFKLLNLIKDQSYEKESVELDIIRTSVDDPPLPAIVTAASSNHFLESQALLQNIHQVLFPRYGAMKIVYFDLGLSPDERGILEKFCNCDVRRFPFENYSPHISNVRSYGWKPKVISEVMIEFKFVMWVDASVRFKNSTNLIDDLLKRSRHPKTPVLVRKGSNSIMERTYAYTFNYLDIDPEKYKKIPIVQSGLIFARYTNFSFEKIIKPWVECGLRYGCMSKGESPGNCPRTHGIVGPCHRFDQSVLGIILNEVYNFDRAKFTFTSSLYVAIRRGHKVQYFPVKI